MRRLVELRKEKAIEERVLGVLVSAVVEDQGELFLRGKTGLDYAEKLKDFFLFLTCQANVESMVWKWYANLQELGPDEDLAGAFESRMKECRLLQARIWEAPIDEFRTGIRNLRKCLQGVARYIIEDEEDDVGRKKPSGEENTNPAQQRQSVLYTVRSIVKKLKLRLDQSGLTVDWDEACGEILSLAESLENSAAAQTRIPE